MDALNWPENGIAYIKAFLECSEKSIGTSILRMRIFDDDREDALDAFFFFGIVFFLFCEMPVELTLDL